MKHVTFDRIVMALVFLVLMTIFMLGIAMSLWPWLEDHVITRGQVWGFVLIACSLYGTRWLLSGRLR